MIIRIEEVLSPWRMISLPLDDKMTVFKSLAIYKMVYIAMILPISKLITDKPQKNKKEPELGVMPVSIVQWCAETGVFNANHLKLKYYRSICFSGSCNLYIMSCLL